VARGVLFGSTLILGLIGGGRVGLVALLLEHPSVTWLLGEESIGLTIK
jgi:hypothetical protein